MSALQPLLAPLPLLLKHHCTHRSRTCAATVTCTAAAALLRARTIMQAAHEHLQKLQFTHTHVSRMLIVASGAAATCAFAVSQQRESSRVTTTNLSCLLPLACATARRAIAHLLRGREQRLPLEQHDLVALHCSNIRPKGVGVVEGAVCALGGHDGREEVAQGQIGGCDNHIFF